MNDLLSCLSRNTSNQEVDYHFLLQNPTEFDQSPYGWRSLHNDIPAQISTINLYLYRYAISPEVWSNNTPLDNGLFRIRPEIPAFHLAQLYIIQSKLLIATDILHAISQTDDPDRNRFIKAVAAFVQGDLVAFKRYSETPNRNEEALGRLRKHWGKPLLFAQCNGIVESDTSHNPSRPQDRIIRDELASPRRS